MVTVCSTEYYGRETSRMEAPLEALRVAILIPLLLTVFPSAAENASAHRRNAAAGQTEIAQALVGHICTTASGATFDFAENGDYTYNGLWRNDGHYQVLPGAILVALHNGLVRSFAVSIRPSGVILENTAIVCKPRLAAGLHH